MGRSTFRFSAVAAAAFFGVLADRLFVPLEPLPLVLAPLPLELPMILPLVLPVPENRTATEKGCATLGE